MTHPLKLISFNDRELLLYHRPGGGWIAILFGCFLLCTGSFGHFHGGLPARSGFLAIGFLFAGIGLRTAQWRERLSVDVVTQRYAYARGFLWRVRRQSGSLNEMEAVTLSTEMREGGRRGPHITWIVGLQFTPAMGAVSIEAKGAEPDARALAEKLIQTFRLPLIDQTVEPAVKTTWQEVVTPHIADAPAKNTWEAASPPQTSSLPPDSGILLAQVSGRFSITLPSAGIRVEALLVIAFMSIPAYLGGQILLGMVQAVYSGAEHYWLGWVIGVMFSLIGTGGVIEGICMMWAHEWLRDEGDTLTLGYRLLGIEYGKAQIEKSAILNVAVSPAESVQGGRARLHQALRTKLPLLGNWQASVAILQRTGRRQFGTALCPASQQWLVDTLRTLCGLRSK